MSIQTISPFERERAVVTALVFLQFVLWLGFAVHRAPRFPGSLVGTVLGIVGALLLVLPSLAYTAVKRIPSLKRRVAARLPLRRLLAWHVWSGIVGSVLAILHTGHRFESTLGLALVGAMLVTVFSGYVGRHLLGRVSMDVRQKQHLLDQLVTAYNSIAGHVAAAQEPWTARLASGSLWARLKHALGGGESGSSSAVDALAQRATEIADSIADLEYAIKTDEVLRGRFRTWLGVHIAASVAFYALLALHVWASLYFGLRWWA